MSDVNEIMARTVLQTEPHALRQMIAEMIDEADEVMGSKLNTDQLKFTSNWLFKWLNERFNYMPMHHVRAALTYGPMGERGGTSTLIPRNINIWLRAQAEILQEQIARHQKKEDEVRRNSDMNKNKAEGFVATAVRIKVFWLADKRITGDEYDSFSSQTIYELLKSGMPEGKIHPRDVVPDYDNHRIEI